MLRLWLPEFKEAVEDRKSDRMDHLLELEDHNALRICGLKGGNAPEAQGDNPLKRSLVKDTPAYLKREKQ